jgi:hypothetical protein
MITWTNEWNEKGQLPSTEESRSRSLETQEDEHNVITGMPDTRIPMMTNRVRFFLVSFIYPRLSGSGFQVEKLPNSGPDISLGPYRGFSDNML